MQPTGSLRSTLTEPDLMLVRVLPACPLLFADELTTKGRNHEAGSVCYAQIIACTACRELDGLIVQIFGKAFTLGGYPPWPIRVTEMYHMGRLQCVSCAQLQATLQQYCSTLQRFGA